MQGNDEYGDTGEWFLDLVNPRDSVATIAPPPDDLSSLAPPLGAATASAAARVSGDSMSDWLPGELSRTYQSGRNFRWPTVIMSLIAVIAVAVGGVWALGQPQRAANERQATFQATVNELVDARAGFDEAVVLISGREGLNAAGPAILDFSTAAEQAASVAGDPIPRSVPLADATPLVDLEATRQALAVASGRASGLSVEAARLQVYVVGVAEVLKLPELPTSATAAAANELSVDLAAALADSLGALANLPDIGEFATHRVELELLVNRYADWQIEYLEALRIGDADRVDVLLADLASQRLQVDETFEEPLRVVASDLLDRSHTLSVELSALQ